MKIVSGHKRELKSEEIKNKDKEINMLERAISSKQAVHKAKMNEIRSGLAMQNELARYNKEMVSLCQDIDNNASKFRSKPIGPIGRFIKLTQEAARNDQLNSLLEVRLSTKELKSFLVESYEDKKCLERMMSKYYPIKSRQPRITIRKR